MEWQSTLAEWTAASEAVGQELVGWRQAHPRATLAEIEAAVQAALSRLQGRYLQDLAQASARADLSTATEGERPACPACGGGLAARGQQERAVLTPRQGEALRLRRSYAVCSVCGTGLFPPG